MDDDAIAAGDLIARRLISEHWKPARTIIALLQAATLDNLGRDQEAGDRKRAFIAAHEHDANWPTQTMVSWLRHELKDSDSSA